MVMFDFLIDIVWFFLGFLFSFLTSQFLSRQLGYICQKKEKRKKIVDEQQTKKNS